MLGVRNVEETAKDREDWRQYVIAAMGLKGIKKPKKKKISI